MRNTEERQVDPSRLLHAKAWADLYELIDKQLSPLGLRAIEALQLAPGEVVVDIGCGAGQTLLQLADRVGTTGRVTGVDISPLLLEIAARRTKSLGSVTLIEADAETLGMPAASADAVYSRFGVMGFGNPVAAFATFHRLLKPSGRLAIVCWRRLDENELDYLPLRAAGLDAALDERPFSFAEPADIHWTLKAAGFHDIVIQPHDEHVSSGNLDAMMAVLTKVGPLGKILRENPELAQAAVPRVRRALAALGDPQHVQLRASVWIVTARN